MTLREITLKWKSSWREKSMDGDELVENVLSGKITSTDRQTLIFRVCTTRAAYRESRRSIAANLLCLNGTWLIQWLLSIDTIMQICHVIWTSVVKSTAAWSQYCCSRDLGLQHGQMCKRLQCQRTRWQQFSAEHGTWHYFPMFKTLPFIVKVLPDNT